MHLPKCMDKVPLTITEFNARSVSSHTPLVAIMPG